jgi:hypothetical protein
MFRQHHVGHAVRTAPFDMILRDFDAIAGDCRRHILPAPRVGCDLALMAVRLRAVAPRVAAGVAQRVAAQQPESGAKSMLLWCCGWGMKDHRLTRPQLFLGRRGAERGRGGARRRAATSQDLGRDTF